MKYELYDASWSDGMTAYVCGAVEGSGNIGDAIAHEMFTNGWRVIGDDCAIGDGSRPPGGNLPDDETAERFGYNITDKGRYQRFEAPSVQAFEQADPDALIITLGKTYKGHFAEIHDWEIANLIRANLTLPLEAARRYVQATEETRRGGGKIIFLGSYAHNHPFTNGTLYCAAKAGLHMAARTLAWELTDRGYRVHIVHPYHVQGTPMWAEVERGVMESKGMSWEEADTYNRKDLKMPDLLTADEVAGVVRLLLCEPEMGWLSGTAVELFGGSR